MVEADMHCHCIQIQMELTSEFIMPSNTMISVAPFALIPAQTCAFTGCLALALVYFWGVAPFLGSTFCAFAAAQTPHLKYDIFKFVIVLVTPSSEVKPFLLVDTSDKLAVCSSPSQLLSHSNCCRLTEQ